MRTVYLICTCFILGSVQAYISNKTYEGYPAGFLPDCPGAMKPAVISKKNLKYIQIFVSGAKDKHRRMYTYDTIGEMAKDPTMDWSKRTLFYVGGFMDNIGLPMGPMVQYIYKQRGYNVWILECLRFMTEEYPVAARAMMAVGKHVGEMIANVTASQPLFDPKKFELTGISLGAQKMSFIAKSYTKLTGLKFSRMTGLDPSGPCFRNRGPEGRIDDSDADFVELVMTNIDGYGMAGPAGHINYYVNGGEIQPGDLYWMACNTVCSHSRVFMLWLSSLIYPDSFIAMKCDNVQDARNSNCYDRNPMVTNVLGLNVDKNKTGIFYLATKNFFPFHLGKSGLMKKNNYVMKMLRNMNANDVLYM